MIQVETVDSTTFEVTVAGPPASTHTVTVSPDYHQQLTGGGVPAGELVRKSFEFLLQREPNTSILSRFDLRVIEQYFPEYGQTIRDMVGG